MAVRNRLGYNGPGRHTLNSNPTMRRPTLQASTRLSPGRAC
jgi:hypothetical protein